MNLQTDPPLAVRDPAHEKRIKWIPCRMKKEALKAKNDPFGRFIVFSCGFYRLIEQNFSVPCDGNRFPAVIGPELFGNITYMAFHRVDADV